MVLHLAQMHLVHRPAPGPTLMNYRRLMVPGLFVCSAQHTSLWEMMSD